MSGDLREGLTHTRRFVVDDERAIGFLAGSAQTASEDPVENARVYATPSLIRDVEQTCRDFLLEFVGEGQDTLGTAVDIKHLAPTLMGMEVEVAIEVASVNKRAVRLAVSVSDPVEEVAKGTHDRFVIDIDQIKQRLRAKMHAVDMT